MARVEITTNFSTNSAFARQIEAITARRTKAVFEEMRVQAIEEVNLIIEEEFITDRDLTRRKKGTRRLANSGRAVVDDTNGGFPIMLRVSTTNNQKKIGALEHGIKKSYTIKGNPWLYFPNTKDAPAHTGVYGKYGSAGGKVKATKAASVRGPTYEGRHFLERAAERVKDRFLSGARI